jgi:hypothetical protein
MIIGCRNNNNKMRYREKTEILRMFTATITARYWKHTYIWKTVGFKTMELFNTIKFEQFKHCENKPLQSEIKTPHSVLLSASVIKTFAFI